MAFQEWARSTLESFTVLKKTDSEAKEAEIFKNFMIHFVRMQKATKIDLAAPKSIYWKCFESDFCRSLLGTGGIHIEIFDE